LEEISRKKAEKHEGTFVQSAKGFVKVGMELDEGAKGIGGSWVEASKVEEWGLRPRKLKDKR
jgi:hypothetical protein